MGDAFIQIDGSSIQDVVDDLRKTERALGKQQRLGNREVAKYVAGKAQGNARSGTRQQRHFADAISPASTQNMARLRLALAGKGQPWAGAYGTFYGARKWPQFPEWVGAGWVYASRTEGPYVLNATVAEEIDVIGKLYQDSYGSAFQYVFPKG